MNFIDPNLVKCPAKNPKSVVLPVPPLPTVLLTGYTAHHQLVTDVTGAQGLSPWPYVIEG